MSGDEQATLPLVEPHQRRRKTMNTLISDRFPVRRTILATGLALLVPLFTSGCNTVSGIGEDVEAAGDAIEKKAEEEKKY